MSTTAQIPDQLFSDVNNTPQQHPPSPDVLFSDGEINQAQPLVNPEQDASNTRQMLVSGLTGMPTPNMTDKDRAQFATGKAAGAGTATLLSASPLLATIAPHLPDLDKAWKIAVGLGGASATVDHLLTVLKTLKGK